MQGTAYLPYAGLKLACLADCVASESEKNPERVYCSVASGEGTREPLKIPVKSCNRSWTSHFAYLGNWDVSQGVDRDFGPCRFLVLFCGFPAPPIVQTLMAVPVRKLDSLTLH